MSREAKVAVRQLATIKDEIYMTLRNDTQSAIRRGALLIEAKAQCKHGAWLKWLDSNFSWDVRTAQRAMRVASWTEECTARLKCDSAVVFNISVEVLYDLSEQSPRVAKTSFYGKLLRAVLAEAAIRPVPTQWVDQLRDTLLDKVEQKADRKAERRAEQEIEREAKKILDGGPPPELPPLEPDKRDPDRYPREGLSTALAALKTLSTKKLDRFAGSEVKLGDVMKVIEFLIALLPIISGQDPSKFPPILFPAGSNPDAEVRAS